MKKFFTFIAFLTLCAELWAINNVPYIDANGQLQKRDSVTGVINSTDTLKNGWYVVMPTGNEKQTGTLVCQGEVHLIIYDGAKLTATGANGKPGIEVSGEGNSLTIYGYTNQSGQLIAIGGANAAGIGGGNAAAGSNITICGGIVTANGGEYAAGIGGGYQGNGTNITINGGTVTATGGTAAAGIGGGFQGSGTNITINGGNVTATGGTNSASGIGDGISLTSSLASNIFVSTDLVVKADGNNPPTTVIPNTGSDLTGSLNGKQYVTIEPAPAVSNNLTDIINSELIGKNSGDTVVLNLSNTIDYVISQPVDLGLVNIIINGNGAKVTLADSTQIAGQQRIEINNVNFDCAANTKLAPIALSANPDSSLVGARFQTEGTTLRSHAFYDTCAIVINGCNFSDVKTPLVSANKREWNLKGLIIRNVVAQFNVASGIDSYICWYGNSKNEGSIKDIVIENSTLYNIVENNSNYFLRYANNSNSQPQKAWPTPQFDGKCSWTMTNNTFVNLPSNKNFANNYPNKNPICEFTWKGNIFYNTTLLQKAIQGNVANFTAADNAIIGITTSVYASDNQYATIDSLLVQGDNRMTTPTTALDFTKIDSLVNNFAPATTSYAGSHGFGDPRWVSTPTPAPAVTEVYIPTDETGVAKTEWVLVSNPGGNIIDIDATPSVHLYAMSGPESGWTSGTTLPLTPVYDNAWGVRNNRNNVWDDSISGTKTLYFINGKGTPTTGIAFAAQNDGTYRVCYNKQNDPTGPWYAEDGTTELTGDFDFTYKPDGSNGMPKYGPYYKLTSKHNGTMKVLVWNDKSRPVYVVDNTTHVALNPLTGEVQYSGYVNGKDEYIDPDDESRGKKMIFYDTLAPQTTNPYCPQAQIAANKAAWVYLTFSVNANQTYWIFNNDKLGFGGFEFTPASVPAPTSATVTANVNDTAMGSVTGAGTYNIGDDVTVIATAKDHYHFVNWSNGETNDTIVIDLAGDTSIVANFAIDTHTVTLAANDATFGTVEGAGTYNYGTQVTAIAVPAAHYHFVNWSNGETNDTIVIDLACDTNLIANFAIDTHTVTLAANDENFGTVEGAGTYNYGTQVTAIAVPAAHYHFVNWSNGETNDTIVIDLAGDTTLTAIFAIDTHTVTLAANDATFGAVEGAGSYAYGTQVTAIAVPAAHYHFENWSNGETNDTIVIDLAGDTTLTANFAIDQHTIAGVANDGTLGTVTGSATVNHGTAVTLTAIPTNGNQFVVWSNGATTPSITIVADQDSSVTAYFVTTFVLDPTVVDPVSGDATSYFQVSSDGYCQDEYGNIDFAVVAGDAEQYMIEFVDPAFADVAWTNLDGNSLSIYVPAGATAGVKGAKVKFRSAVAVINSETVYVESDYLPVTFVVNLPKEIIRVAFDDVLVVDNSDNNFTTYQWYRNGEPIEGATKGYYQEVGGLNGDSYYVCVNPGADDMARTCLFTAPISPVTAKSITVYPSPVNSNTTIELRGFESGNHMLRVYNNSGVEVMSQEFTGFELRVDFGNLSRGNYLVTVDGVVEKVVKY